MHKTYSTGCKFHADSDQVDTILWVDALPTAPVLPFPSAFLNIDLEPDKWNLYPIGEQPDLARPWLTKTVPPGLDGVHYCGTPQMFLNGDTTNGREPSTKYAANGWPLCCQPPLTPLGGYGVAGLSPVAQTPPLAPGPTCPTATLLRLNQIVNYVTDPTPGILQWWYFETPPISGTYILHMHYNGGSATIQGELFRGPTGNPCGNFWTGTGWGFDFSFPDGGWPTITLGVYGYFASSVPYTLWLSTYP